MQSKFKVRTDFKEKIKGNPCELLSDIQEHSISYHVHQYEIIKTVDVTNKLMTLRQTAKYVMEANIS